MKQKFIAHVQMKVYFSCMKSLHGSRRKKREKREQKSIKSE